MNKQNTSKNYLADNLKYLMERSETLNTQRAVATKAGIAQTAVGYLLNPNNDAMKSPLLSNVEKVAAAFGFDAWELILPPEMFNARLNPDKSAQVYAETNREKSVLLAFRRAPEQGKQLLEFAVRAPYPGTSVAKGRKASNQ